MDIKSYPVENYVNKDVKTIKSKHFKFVIVGDGSTVISQLPSENEKLKEGSEVILFT